MPGLAPLGTSVTPLGTAAVGQAESQVAPPLVGHVSFTVKRQTQAVLLDIAVGATVSLIDTSTNMTVSTALTDGNGMFILTFPNGFRPNPNLTYYLEAYKGLGSNLPSQPALRVRTLVKYNGSWTSISSGGVNINPGTTALAIGAALRNGQSAFNFASLMGTLSGGTTYTPVASLSAADFNNVLNIVNTAMGNNADPVANVGLSGGNWVTLGGSTANISVTSISPSSGSVGTPVTINGAGFSSTLSSNYFKFNAALATLTSGTTTQLQGTVPNGAVSGQTTMQVGTTIVLGPLFTVPPTLTGMSPASGSPGTSILFTGSGFDGTTLANNAVTFGGATATVTFASPGGIQATVPTTAVSGPVSITVGGVTTTSSSSFIVPLSVTGITPIMAQAGNTISLTGSGFSTTPASNTVTLGGATASVVSATPNTLVLTAPFVQTPGPTVVTVAGVTVTNSSVVFRNLLPITGGLATASNAYKIDTLAGVLGLTAGQPSAYWPLYQPTRCCVDSTGSLYFPTQEYVNGGGCCTTYYSIGKISNGVYSRVVGANPAGSTGDGGSAMLASLNNPNGVAVDSAGNVYIADYNNNRVRKVTASTGVISNFAGSGAAGFSGDGGSATAAQLNNPIAVAVDSSGNVYISDWSNQRIRKVSISGTITTVAGSNTAGYAGDGGQATSAQINRPVGLALDSLGNLYFSDYYNNRIRMVTPTGTISTVVGNGSGSYSGDGGAATASAINNPQEIAIDSANNLYIADWSNHRIRKVTASTQIITTVAGNGTQGYSGDGGAATSAQLNNPIGVAVDGSGNLYVMDYGNNVIRKVTGGTITSITTRGNIGYTDLNHGDGGPALYAGFNNNTNGAAMDAAGNTYIADSNNHRIRMISPSGVITTVAGNGNAGFSGDGGPATSARLYSPNDVVVDAAGNLYIADYNNNRIRKVDTSGNIWTICGSSAGFSGDGGPAVNAQLNNPLGLALDPVTNNLYVSDGGNARIRQIQTSTGLIFTVAGSGYGGYAGDGGLSSSAVLNVPTGLCFVPPNNLYIADANNHRVRLAVIGGNISTVAGNGSGGFSGDGAAATSAQLYNPWGVRVDGVGNVYISDYNNNRIRMVNNSGVISTMAGNGTAGLSGNGGLAINASLNKPRGLVLDSNGGLRVVDSSNNVVRIIR
jgi:sugar lactone lactonase YvrE